MQNTAVKPSLLSLMSFCSGLILMFYEMLLPRIFSLYYGNTFLAWSAIIGFVMFGLSLGNRAGGRGAEKMGPLRTVSLAFLSAGVFFFFFTLLRDDFFLLVSTAVRNESGAVLLSSLGLSFPPAFFFGATSTNLLGCVHSLDGENRISVTGRILAANTVGSIAGTFLASFVLIPLAGIEKSLWLLSAMSLAAGAYPAVLCLRGKNAFVSGKEKGRKKGRSSLAFVLPCLAIPLMFYGLPDLVQGPPAPGKYGEMTVVDEFDTMYSHIRIVDTKDRNGRTVRRILDGAMSYSKSSPGDPNYAAAYTEYFHIPFGERPGIRDVLMIGAGGYSFPKQALARYDSAVLDVVDIDEKMVLKAKEYFEVPETPRMSTIISDGRRYVETTERRYDLVAVDVFQGKQVPAHMCTREFFAGVKGILKDESSYLVLNVIAEPEGKFLKSFSNTIWSVFGDVRTFLVEEEGTRPVGRERNIVIVAVNRPLVPGKRMVGEADGEVFTDDRPVSDVMMVM